MTSLKIKNTIKSKRNNYLIYSILLIIGWLFLFYPLYTELLHTWTKHSNNNHGILVPLISVFFIWSRREQIQKCTKQNSLWGLLVLLISLIIYIISYAGAITVIARLMIVATLIGLVIYNLGWEVFITIRFPLLFLIFMVPVPQSIYSIVALPLQLFASKVSATLISLTAIPVYREGNMLYFVQTHLEVAEACSGLRSITAFIMLSAIFAYMSSKKGYIQRSALVLSAIPIALIINIFRVTGTGILAHYFGGDIARGFLHEFSGIIVFILGFAILGFIYHISDKDKKA